MDIANVAVALAHTVTFTNQNTNQSTENTNDNIDFINNTTKQNRAGDNNGNDDDLFSW